MNRQISVLVADDNMKLAKSIEEYLSTQPFVRRAYSVYNGAEAWKMICEINPDVVILDMIMPVEDGISVLRKLSAIKNRPKVIMHSAAVANEAVEAAFKYGAVYYMVKPQPLYSISRVIYELCMGEAEIKERVIPNSQSRACGDIEQAVAGAVCELGIPPHMKGAGYIRSAVKMAVENTNALRCITKHMYPEIARIYGTNAGSVEKAIRRTIEAVWRCANPETLEEKLGSSVYMKKDRPTNSEFIAAVADRIRSDLRKH